MSLAILASLLIAAPPGAQVVLRHGDPRVGTYVSSDAGFETSSYWIEGPSGLILIDTQFLLSATAEAVEWAEKSTGKKVELAIVLHPNPDKFNGTDLLRKRGIKVVTSEQVRAVIPAVHELRKKWFYERFAPDYPAELTPPDSFGPATTELSAGGVTVNAHVLAGPGCSAAHVVIEWEKHVFPGDLVTNGFHSWLELGLIEPWLKRLDELEALEPEYVHPGRGPSGGVELLVRQRHYLERVLEIVRPRKQKGKPSEAVIESTAKQIYAAFPGLRFGRFVTLGLPEVFAQLQPAPARSAGHQ